MKNLLLALPILATTVQAAEPVQSAEEVKAKVATFQAEARGLDTFALYKEMRRLEASRDARIALMKPEEAAAMVFNFNDEDLKLAHYVGEMSKRSEGGEVPASFYDGAYQWRWCAMWQDQKGSQAQKLATECWQKAMAAFKRAANANINWGDASSNVATMYAKGLGVSPSKLAAAEWYVKAAEQYTNDRKREPALTAIEDALNLVPDHPAALRLRKAMLK